MFRVFKARTADSVWAQIADAFRDGEGASQSSRVGEMREILHSAISISEPTQRWVASRHPPINLAFAIAEVVWILTGRNDSAFLNYFNKQLPKFAGEGETYHGAYGHRLRVSLGIDQLERAYQALMAKPTSRQIVLQIWDGRIDLPTSSGQEASPDIPCNLISLLKVRGDKLEWLQVMRSNDIYRGLPYNIVQFTTMQEVMAGWLGLGMGDYNHISDSLHLYDSDLDSVQSSHLRPAIDNSDSLAFPKEESDRYFRELAHDIERIIDPSVSAEALASMVRESGVPTSFRNLLRVLCAEGARRRRQEGVMSDIMINCTNPAYRDLYNQWLMRRP